MEDWTKEKLAESLTAETVELIPFLPYLLQDLWMLGSSPDEMEAVLREHAAVTPQMRVIDLACGKGAVSVGLARVFGVRVKGVDILPEFIDYARDKAREYGVDRQCDFEVADVKQVAAQGGDYDIAVWGAAGDLMGDNAATLKALRDMVRPGGLILMDDAYLESEGAEVKFHHDYLTRGQWLRLMEELGLELVAERTAPEGDDSAINDENNRNIQKRARELMERHPDKRGMFEGYIQSQLDECEDLDEGAVGVLWLMKRK